MQIKEITERINYSYLPNQFGRIIFTTSYHITFQYDIIMVDKEENKEALTMPKNTQRLCIMDSFEGDWAVIEYGDKTFNFPKELLPPHAKEGDVLKFDVEINKEETEKRRKIIKDLADELFIDD